jgi:hypothetical protein
MGAYKNLLLDQVESVGTYLTDINAHTVRTLLEWVINGDTGNHTEEALLRAYESARDILNGTERATR